MTGRPTDSVAAHPACRGAGRAARRITALAALALLAGGLGALLAACAPARDKAALAIGLPAEVPAGLELQWERVSGADGYRLVFARMTGAPVCTVRVDAQEHPGFLILRDSLPTGLAHGWQLNVEVRAMRHGEPMTTSGSRPLRTP